MLFSRSNVLNNLGSVMQSPAALTVVERNVASYTVWSCDLCYITITHDIERHTHNESQRLGTTTMVVRRESPA